MLTSVLQHVSAQVLKAIYSSPISGSPYNVCLGQKYYMTVLDTIFVRKQHRDKQSGLLMLKDFVDSFDETSLGLRYPLSAFMHKGKLFGLFFCIECSAFQGRIKNPNLKC